jgi:predicted HicB family RNase H-like nuclease
MVDFHIYCIYNRTMKSKKRGRPPKEADQLKDESLLVRVGPDEKEAFKDAADLAGISLSSWVRERLRRNAIVELQEAARPIAFLR